MKRILFFIVGLFLVSVSLAKEVEVPFDIKGHWQIDHLIGYPEKSSNVDYTLRQIVLTPDMKGGGRFFYGRQLKVDDDLSFKSYYTAPCGVDCFPETQGKIIFVDQTHVRIKLEFIKVMGMMCKKEFEKKLEKDLGVFEIERTNDEIRLIRQSSGIKKK